MNVERVRKVGEDMDKVLSEFPYGCTNPEAIRRLSDLAEEAVRESSKHIYVRAKANSLRSIIRVLYSRRNHRKHNGRRSFASSAEYVLQRAKVEVHCIAR